MNISSVNKLFFGKTIHTVVENPHGLHFAPCSAIAEITRKVEKPVYFSRENDSFEKDIRGSMMSLAVMEFTHGDKVAIRVDDDYPEYALRAILNCVKSKTSSI